MQEQLQQYEQKLDEILIPENLPAIVCLLNALRPHNDYRVLHDEFSTVVHAAKLDGMDDLIRSLVHYVGNKNNVN